jgi:hypothetical protein
MQIANPNSHLVQKHPGKSATQGGYAVQSANQKKLTRVAALRAGTNYGDNPQELRTRLA